jgi:hypothetical protein
LASSFRNIASRTFITLSVGTYSISPPLNDFVNLGLHTVWYYAINAANTIFEIHSFTVNVTNTAPYFVKEVPYSFSMKFNNTFNYILPNMTDPEGNAITYYLLSDPPVDAFLTLGPD